MMFKQIVFGAVFVAFSPLLSQAQGFEIVCEEEFGGVNANAAVAVLEAYDDAVVDLAAKVANLRARGFLVRDSWIEVIDVTHVFYDGTDWYMALTVRFHVDFGLRRPKPWILPYPWKALP